MRSGVVCLVVAAPVASACQTQAPQAEPRLPPGFYRAEYILEWPEPQYPPGTGPADVIVPSSCFYPVQNGRVAALPFAARIEANGTTSTYDRYCLG